MKMDRRCPDLWGGPGTCQPDALRFVVEHRGWVYCMGTMVAADGSRMGHAGAELRGEYVWEPFNKVVVPLRDFYEHFKVSDVHIFEPVDSVTEG